MPELRRDPVVGRWVVFTDDLAGRLERTGGDAPPVSPCPFCEGRESRTPREILAFRAHGTAADGPGWRVRVVPNKYPVLRVEGHLDHASHGMFDRMNGVGAHEVIVETPRHVASPASLEIPEIEEGLWAARERIVDLRRDGRLVHASLFRSVGAAAGARVAHAHSQLLVAPVVPSGIEREIAGAGAYHGFRGRCVWCDVVREECREGARVVAETDHFVAFAPYASRSPFESWVVPRLHASRFEETDRARIRDLASVFKHLLARLEAALDRPPYNTFLHTAPFPLGESPHFHWHFEVTPRLGPPSGFEWGSGFEVNPVRPEVAAAALRDARV